MAALISSENHTHVKILAENSCKTFNINYRFYGVSNFMVHFISLKFI